MGKCVDTGADWSTCVAFTLPAGLQSSKLPSRSSRSSPAAEKISFSGIPGNFLNSM